MEKMAKKQLCTVENRNHIKEERGGKGGVEEDSLRLQGPRKQEKPFGRERKRRTKNSGGGQKRLFRKRRGENGLFKGGERGKRGGGPRNCQGYKKRKGNSKKKKFASRVLGKRRLPAENRNRRKTHRNHIVSQTWMKNVTTEPRDKLCY